MINESQKRLFENMNPGDSMMLSNTSKSEVNRIWRKCRSSQDYRLDISECEGKIFVTCEEKSDGDYSFDEMVVIVVIAVVMTAIVMLFVATNITNI